MNEIDILVEKSATYMLSAASRTYYAMFYLTQALLLTENVQVSTHLGVNNKFGLLFVRTEIFPKEFGKYLSYAAQRRSTGDYEIYNRIDQETAEDLLNTAHIFNAGLKAYLTEKGFLS